MSDEEDTEVRFRPTNGADTHGSDENPEQSENWMLHQELKLRHAQEEREHEMKKMELEARVQRERQEFELRKLELELQSRAGSGSSGNNDQYKGPKVPKFKEGDDIDTYLRSFEKLAEIHAWKRETWATRLAALLSGKALEAYSRLSTEDSGDYRRVREAILRRYELTAEAYRTKMRSTKKGYDETFKEWSVSVSGYFDRWLEAEGIESDFGQLRELIITEQLLESTPRELQMWLRERKLTTVKDLAESADHYLATHGKGTEVRKPFSAPVAKANLEGKDGTKKYADYKGKSSMSTSRDRTCFRCGKPGHIAVHCRSTAPKGTEKKSSILYGGKACPIETGSGGSLSDYRMGGMVDGREVVVLRDTGCSQSLVNARFVSPAAYLSERRRIQFADGGIREIPVALLDLQCQSVGGMVKAGVLKKLPEDFLLGNDLVGKHAVPEANAYAVTRQQAARLQRREKEAEEEMQITKVKPNSMGLEAEVVPLSEGEKKHKSSSELKICDLCPESSMDATEVAGQTFSECDEWINTAETTMSKESLDLGPSEVKKLQQEDETLCNVRQLVHPKECDCDDSVYFFEKNGLLLRYWKSRCGSHEETQIVVPKLCRLELMRVAHDVPLAGHLGMEKTKSRLMKNYYWPGIFKDVATYCRTCEKCQKSARKKASEKSALVSMPIIDEPFRRIAVDIVGPLPRSKRGNRYILVICDYATRYPEAIPIPSMTTEVIAEELITLFSRVGIPDEILTDQGTNFMSKLMVEVCTFLKIKKLRSSPYHAQTNGLVERCNGSLKAMLRKYDADDPLGWDRFVPYLLFAYREVPQSSTGFSPFELLYGRHVRGPLDVVKEVWTGEISSGENIVQYVLDMREKMESMRELVHENLAQAQQRQKVWYDKGARSRTFDAGDKVLVLLQAQWQGPYEVIQRISATDYKIATGGRKKSKVMHINMLRKWHKRLSSAFLADEVDAIEEHEGCVWQEERKETWRNVRLDEALTAQQRNETSRLLSKFDDVLSDVPGRTNVIEHEVHTTDDVPVRKKPYRLPQSKRDMVKEELKKMEELGIIQPSRSPYAAPIVLVEKPDKTVRFCVDYRALNKITVFDPYPAQRIDTVIEKIGQAKFISKLDLTKGYWQVSLSENARKKSAFISPFGLYEFCVMPFGMQNSAATFTRLMNAVLRECEAFSDAYIDDVVIFSDVWEDHLHHLNQVLTALRKAGLTTKPSKCHIASREISYLGFIIGNGKVRPQPEKVSAIHDYPQPTTKKDVRSFLGLARYYQKLIPLFSEIAAPLTDLTKKGQPVRVQWNIECEAAFQKIKESLTSNPVLKSPDFSKPFTLHVDASDRGLGAVLSQTDNDGEHPVTYLSRKLLPRERSYATVEKECLSMVWAVQKLHSYLYGRQFIVFSDHHPLKWLHQLKDKNQRLLRWSLVLQEYTFEVTHRSGKLNANADSLSRIWAE